MSDVQVQMEGIVTPTYDKRRKGYKFKADGMEIFIKGADTDAGKKAAVDQMSRLLEQQKEKEEKEKAETKPLVFAEGGLKDEGGTVDPVSGNTVPSGSTQKEVRDDIPAQLSEGEFIFPADVVRYIGLENLMELRQKAKVGLARMEDMGQMGNSEEAIIDDSGEYNDEIDQLIDNFDPDDPEIIRFAEGGVVYAQQGAFVPGMPQQQFSYGFMPPQQQSTQAPIYPQAPDYTQFVSRPAQLATTSKPAQVEDRQYIGPNGELITIRFMDGKAQQQIPAGFKVYKPEEVQPEIVAPTVVTQPDDGNGADDREREQEDRARMEKERGIYDVLSAYSPELKEVWDKDPFKTGEFAFPTTAALAAVTTATTATKSIPSIIDAVNKQYGLNLQEEEYKNEGVSSLFSTYNKEALAKDIMDQVEDAEEGRSIREAEEEARKQEAIAKTGRVSYQVDEDEPVSTPTPTPTPTATERFAASEDIGVDSDGPSDSQTDQASADKEGGVSGVSPFSEGGAVQEQTKRALKSSRKKK